MVLAVVAISVAVPVGEETADRLVSALRERIATFFGPEIGDAFGGRDHTTVIHACRKVAELKASDARVQEDYSNLERILTT